jgi:hypothetical protein
VSRAGTARPEERAKRTDRDPAAAPPVAPPLKPRPRLFAGLMVVFALWLAFLLWLYFKTVYPMRSVVPGYDASGKVESESDGDAAADGGNAE